MNAIDEKKKLEADLHEIISNFEERTGLTVMEVRLLYNTERNILRRQTQRVVELVVTSIGVANA